MIKLLKPIAHCYGVINAINLAKKVASEYKDKNIYVFGLLVHNEEVVKELENNSIKTVMLFLNSNQKRMLFQIATKNGCYFSAQTKMYALSKCNQIRLHLPSALKIACTFKVHAE